jgi:IclR family KDG regulon transcriptional repressor
LDLIEIIAETGSLGVRELSSRTGFPPTTVHRMMATLTERGYLQQNPSTRNYSLSTRFLEFADRVQQQFDLLPMARPHLERLCADTGENVNLGVREGTVVVYIDHVHSQTHTLQTFTRLGARVPLYATGVGKVFLSRMKTPELDAYLKKITLKQYTEKTITDRNLLTKELARVRKQGYAVDNQEKEHGVRCIAAPVLNYNELMIAAVSISGASQWIPMERIHLLARMVINCAARISAELGYKDNKSEINIVE